MEKSKKYHFVQTVLAFASVCLTCVSSEVSVELRDGYSSSSGRVVLTIDGVEGTLCDIRGWGNVDARVLCASLNYSLGFAVGGGVFQDGDESLLVDDLRCSTNDISLDDCDPITYGNCYSKAAAGVICANDWTEVITVDLVNGTLPNMGKVELAVEGKNRTEVCLHSWYNGEADVVCRMLNYSSGISMQDLYDRDSDRTLTDGFYCSGNEDHLFNCNTYLGWTNNCPYYSYAPGVICLSNSTDGFTVELVGSNNSYKGAVVFRNTYFNATLDPSYMSSREAAYICAVFGYSFRAGLGIRSAYFGSYEEDFELTQYSNCALTGKTLVGCSRAYLRKTSGLGHGASVICIEDFSKDVVASLVNGSNLYEMSGRVVLNLYGEIDVYVCDDYFDETDAYVICKSFGYSYGIPFGGKYFGNSASDEVLFLRQFQCSNRINTIEECLQNSYIEDQCSGYASVICHNGSYTPDVSVELRNGTSPGAGRVYLHFDEFEGALTDYYWYNTDAATVCAMLNFSSGIATGRVYTSPDWKVLVSNIRCGLGMSNITECSFQAYGKYHYSTYYAATVACFDTDADSAKQSMKFTLLGGSSANYGVLEATVLQHKGTVCDRSFSSFESYADVGCRSFGYSYGMAIHKAKFGLRMEMNPILLSELSCSGTENTIVECGSTFGGYYPCDHWDDIGLFCSEKPFGTESCIQLVDGQSNTSGTLEIVVDGVPIPIAYHYYDTYRPLQELAPWFCSLLGFRNSTGSVSSKSNTKALAFSSISCTDEYTSITECLSGWTLRGDTPSSVLTLSCEANTFDGREPVHENDSCSSGRNSCPPMSDWVLENDLYSCKCHSGFERTPLETCEGNNISFFGRHTQEDVPTVERCLEHGYADLFPYGDDQGDSSFKNKDDECKPAEKFPINVPIFGKNFKKAYICTNGLVAFGSRYTRSVPQAPVYFRHKTVLAPYYADIDTRKKTGGGKVYHQLYYRGAIFDPKSEAQEKLVSILRTSEHFVSSIDGISSFRASIVLVVTWHEVHPFRNKQGTEKATFQLVLVSDGSKTYTFYIYGQCLMQWTEFKRILVGYSSKFNTRQNEHSFQTTALIMDKYTKTNGIKGLLFYNLTDGVNETPNYDDMCIQWHSENLHSKHYVKEQMDLMQECPCNMVLLNLDFWYIPYSDSRNKLCAQLRPFWAFRNHGKTCCYNKRTGAFLTALNKAGSFQKFHPLTHSKENKRHDVKMRLYCCKNSKQGLCNKYFDVRPVGSCYTFYPFRPAWFFGDPHIKTLDGISYTFNGHGEYIMLRFRDNMDPLIFQARMERAENANGNLTDATVFTAFAVQDNTSRVQVELNRNKTRMIIYANDRDYSNDFYNSENFTISTDFLDLSRQDDKIIVLFKSSGISFETFPVMDLMLQLALTVPTIHQNLLEGLLGNYDNNTENEFVYPNGTTISGNSSDKSIFSFGQSWMVDESSTIFQYEPGKGNSDFTDIMFVPFFMDEANRTQIAIAEQLCNTTNLPCIYDYLSTQNKDVAISTLGTDYDTYGIAEKMENEIPTISGPGVVLLTVGEEVEITVSGSDDGSFNYVFTDDTDINATVVPLVDGNAKVVWTPTSSDPVTLGVSVEDDHGVEASPAEFQFVLCTGCNSHGSCYFNETREDNRTTPMFSYATCECSPFWEGDDCEVDFDGCEEAPCHPERECFDYNATMHEALNMSHWCSPCPNGMYEDEEGKCIDIDECSNGTHNCEQVCLNTEMSFECSCEDGYRQSSTDQTKCDDIDECTEYFGLCSQVCINSKGNYTCGCYEGFLYTSNNTCKKVSDPCQDFSHNCSLTTGCMLVDGNPECFCSSGYYMSSDGTSCNDVNECDLGACPQGCNNTEGGYECYCYTGYLLNQLGTACTECPFPLHGDNCENECTCGRGSNVCNHIKGCICEPGWKGTDCDDDVDECAEDPFACDLLVQKCVNSAGSYSCQCKDGYQLNSAGDCVDIDECSDIELNTCAHVCENVQGTNICKCGTGYVTDPNNETSCIDINECATGLSDCEHICLNQEGGYDCQCHPGFTLLDDRKNCVKLKDVCAEVSNLTCSHICILSENATARCDCPLGLSLDTDNITCADINECASNETNHCSNQSLCTNTLSGYTCSCDIGFKLENDGITCKVCDEFHYGQNCEHECNCGPGAVTCDTVSGCICNAGWLGDDCTTDMDECESSPCDTTKKFICSNTPGNYSCVCASGYSMAADGNCKDINECADATLNTCEQKCVNTEEGYSCECETGFQQVNDSCVDVDECIESGPCQQLCWNTLGGYTCSCIEGYSLNLADRSKCKECTDGTYGVNCLGVCDCDLANVSSHVCNKTTGACTCVSGWTGYNCTDDVNECSNGDHNCHLVGQTCVNDIGTFHCQCSSGFNSSANGTCTDVDECQLADACEDMCTNTIGSFECSCQSGFILNTTDNTTCTDDDECVRASEVCPQHSVCTNKIGSYNCTCLNNYEISNDGLCTPTAGLVLVEFNSRLQVSKSSRKKRSAVSDQDIESMSYLTSYLGNALTSVTVVSMLETSTSIVLTIDLLVNGNTGTLQLLTQAMISFYNDGYSYGGNNYTMEELSVGGVTISGNTAVDMCAVFEAISGSCQDGSNCEVRDNFPVCRAKDSTEWQESDNQGLIVGLAVGIPTVILVAIAVLVVIYCKKKHAQTRRKSALTNSKVSVAHDDTQNPYASEIAWSNKPNVGPYRQFKNGSKRPLSGNTETPTQSRPVSASGLSFDMFVTDFSTESPKKTTYKQGPFGDDYLEETKMENLE